MIDHIRFPSLKLTHKGANVYATEAWSLTPSPSLIGAPSRAGLGWTNPAQYNCGPWQAVTKYGLEALVLARAGKYPSGHALASHFYCTARRDVKPVSKYRVDSSMRRPHFWTRAPQIYKPILSHLGLGTAAPRTLARQHPPTPYKDTYVPVGPSRGG